MTFLNLIFDALFFQYTWFDLHISLQQTDFKSSRHMKRVQISWVEMSIECLGEWWRMTDDAKVGNWFIGKMVVKPVNTLVVKWWEKDPFDFAKDHFLLGVLCSKIWVAVRRDVSSRYSLALVCILHGHIHFFGFHHTTRSSSEAEKYAENCRKQQAHNTFPNWGRFLEQ